MQATFDYIPPKCCHCQGKLAFIAQDYNTKKIITILDNRRQTTIRNHFFKYSKEAREGVKIGYYGHVW